MVNEKRLSLFHRIVSKLGLVLFGLLFGCLLAEVTLRVAGYSYPEFYQPDNQLGYALRPNMQGWYRKEGSAYVQINSDGLRDREHTRVKPPGTFRIAIIGDSYPEAFPVELEEAFWSVMAAKLQACDPFHGSQVEVINFGVSGYSTAQELITLRERVWAYSPDLVMLTITTNNDISDNLPQLKRTDQIPYFAVVDGKLTLDDSFKGTSTFRWRQSPVSRFGRWIRDHSRVIQAVIQGHHGFKIWFAARRASRPQAAQPAAGNNGNEALPASEETGIDNLIYREPRDKVWQDAWDITEKLILQMRDEVTSRGAQFVIVTLSNGLQVYPDEAARQAASKRLGATDLLYPDKRIQQFALANHMNVMTLAPQLQAYAQQHKVYLHGFGKELGNGHWNQLGHRVAGELIAQRLCEDILRRNEPVH